MNEQLPRVITKLLKEDMLNRELGWPALGWPVGLLLCGIWATSIASVWNQGRIPWLDGLCPPCGVVHGAVIWKGVALATSEPIDSDKLPVTVTPPPEPAALAQTHGPAPALTAFDVDAACKQMFSIQEGCENSSRGELALSKDPPYGNARLSISRAGAPPAARVILGSFTLAD
jgi:hypothetical protein